MKTVPQAAASRQKHPHPNRHRKALGSAITLALLGLLVIAVGVAAIWMGMSGLFAGLVVAGITMLLLSPVWYFTYMENLEPALYQHDAPDKKH